MKLPDKSQLTDAKYQQILDLLTELRVNLADIEEKFVRGSGSGGQKINKTSSAVQLRHVPTGTMVKCQRFREQSMNRIIALRELLEKLNPNAKADARAEKARKQKQRRKRRGSSGTKDGKPTGTS